VKGGNHGSKKSSIEEKDKDNSSSEKGELKIVGERCGRSWLFPVGITSVTSAATWGPHLLPLLKLIGEHGISHRALGTPEKGN
jgi:hypothetical protein